MGYQSELFPPRQLHLSLADALVEAGSGEQHLARPNKATNVPIEMWWILERSLKQDPALLVDSIADFAIDPELQLDPHSLEIKAFGAAKQRLMQHYMEATHLITYCLAASPHSLALNLEEVQLYYPTRPLAEQQVLTNLLQQTAASIDFRADRELDLFTLISEYWQLQRENYSYFKHPPGSRNKPKLEGSVVSAKAMRAFCEDPNLIANIEHQLTQVMRPRFNGAARRPVADYYTQPSQAKQVFTSLPKEHNPEVVSPQLKLNCRLQVNFKNSTIPSIQLNRFLPYLMVSKTTGKTLLLSYNFKELVTTDEELKFSNLGLFNQLSQFVDIVSALAYTNRIMESTKTGKPRLRYAQIKSQASSPAALSVTVDLADGLIWDDYAREHIDLSRAIVRERYLHSSGQLADHHLDFTGNSGVQCLYLANLARIATAYSAFLKQLGQEERALNNCWAYVLPELTSHNNRPNQSYLI